MQTEASPATPEDDELPAGTRLGGFVVRGTLGRGGMGIVYRAEDSVIGREVALKLLPRALGRDAELLARFLEEARAAGGLEHPNVVPIYQAAEHAGTHYLVMPLVMGGCVADHIVPGAPMGWQRATRMVADACRGLGAAHAQGLIHRDVKPANLLLGTDGVVRVADFGLAKALSGRGHEITRTGAIVGTPAYMSPEQCKAKALDERSDLYSLGATYFAMLTGQNPFSGGDTMQVMFAHCSAPVPDPRAVHAAVPEVCARIAMRAMAKSPEDRYESAGEMLAELERALGAEPGAGSGVGPDGPVRVGGRSQPVPRPVQTVASQDALQPRRSPRRTALVVAALAALAAVSLAAWRDRRGPASTAGRGAQPSPIASPARSRTSPAPRTSPAAMPVSPLPRAKELLEFLDAEAGAIAGRWRMDGRALICEGDDRYARLQIPQHVAGPYRWRIAVTREAGESLLAVGFPAQGGQGMLVVDWRDPRRGAPVCGFELVNGVGLDAGTGTVQPGRSLPAGQRHELVLNVAQDGVTAELDRSPLAAHRGPLGAFSIKRSWATPEPAAFFLGTWGSPANPTRFRFDRLVVEPRR